MKWIPRMLSTVLVRGQQVRTKGKRETTAMAKRVRQNEMLERRRVITLMKRLFLWTMLVIRMIKKLIIKVSDPRTEGKIRNYLSL